MQKLQPDSPEYKARWLEHYQSYLEDFDGRPSITTVDAAEQYADDMMEEEGEDTP